MVYQEIRDPMGSPTVDRLVGDWGEAAFISQVYWLIIIFPRWNKMMGMTRYDPRIFTA